MGQSRGARAVAVPPAIGVWVGCDLAVRNAVGAVCSHPDWWAFPMTRNRQQLAMGGQGITLSTYHKPRGGFYNIEWQLCSLFKAWDKEIRNKKLKDLD